jgi:hypothetical protein
MPPKKKQDAKKPDAKRKGNAAVSRNKKTPDRKGVPEEKLVRIMRAKEQRDIGTFYQRGEVEPEEETLEQKVRRNRKELKDNTL